jgi:NAD(P)-dependent dehydrogenase (short-subunit alcohol dehydrogenase family)
LTSNVAGRTAVVTGASRGIGAGIASALASEGMRVVMIARNEAKLKEYAARFKGSIPISCDISDPESVERASKEIQSELGAAPDILINNAGIFSVAVAEETSAEMFVEMINTNLVGPFLFVRAFLGDMKKRRKRRVFGSQVRPARRARSSACRAAWKRGENDAHFSGGDQDGYLEFGHHHRSGRQAA